MVAQKLQPNVREAGWSKRGVCAWARAARGRAERFSHEGKGTCRLVNKRASSYQLTSMKQHAAPIPEQGARQFHQSQVIDASWLRKTVKVSLLVRQEQVYPN